VSIAFEPEALTGFLLALVRAAAWIFVSPPFSTRIVPTPVKLGLAAALALAVQHKMGPQAVPLETVPLLGAAVVQAATGLALGFLTMLLFSALQAAGELIDLFSGLTVAQAFDPLSLNQSSVFGRFYQLLATTLLFAVDGHLLLVKGFLTSFDAVPLEGLRLDRMAELLTSGIATFLLAAVEIAAPLLAVLFVTEMALALLSRAAPLMNVFVLGMPLKIGIVLVLAGVALPLLPDAVSSLVGQALRSGATLLAAGGELP
jgi:flagellar biosynthesis protein FliR